MENESWQKRIDFGLAVMAAILTGMLLKDHNWIAAAGWFVAMGGFFRAA